MKILITGGTGFIGSHVTHALLQAGHSLYLLVRPESNTWRIDDVKDKFKLLPYSKLNDLEDIFPDDIDGVVHLATLYKKTDDALAVPEMIETNITLPSMLLELASRNKCQFFINTGTCFEYKLSKEKLSEESPREAYNYYAATKLAFEDILAYRGNNSLVKTATLRLFYPYGEKDNRKLISLLMNSFINSEPLKLSKGIQELNYTYVNDLVSAYEKLILFLSSQKSNTHEVFNIGTDQAISLRKIVSTIHEITEKQNLITFGNSHPNRDIMYMNCNYSKAKRLLGWEPQVSIKEGLVRVYQFYKSNPKYL